MIKDRAIKEQALRYAVTRRWYPHMEVEVAPPARMGRRVSLVTDIDVLAIAPDPVMGSDTVLFDCKTKAGESGANRSLWLKGLMGYFEAKQAFCVLKKANIESDHRQLAQELGVLLIPEDEFELFGRVSAGRDLVTDAAVASVDAWDKIAELRRRFPAISPLLQYRQSEFWRNRASHAGCRKIVAHVLEYRSEFDPAHIEYEALFGDFTSLFGLEMASLVNSVFRLMLLPSSAIDFEDAVRMKLYGGRDEYEQQNKLFKLLKQARHGSDADEDLAPPEWPRLIKLLRQLLDDPNACFRSALILKECAFSSLTHSDVFLRSLSKDDAQAVRFAILIVSYFARATRVPPEFGDRLETKLLKFA
ncbi:hypothetical protein [Lysobacter sp. 1R34A]|uniref:hypothetical protein n=1 Tax=Lysobacter sp. 1R34A TaxID=3445786 RepID=UPI003EEB008D